MRLLITGGSGFLGQALARRLARPGAEIVLFDPLPPAAEFPGTRWVEGDVADCAAVATAIAQLQPEAIVHLAALLTDAAASDPVAATRVNCLGTAVVLTEANRQRVRRVVAASSLAALGSPPSVYGATKAFGDQLAAALRSEGNTEIVGVRFGWVYGPGRARGWNVLQDLIEGFASEQAVVPYPAFREPVDWTYLDDAVSALCWCLELPSPAPALLTVQGDRRPVTAAVGYLQALVPTVQPAPYPATLPPAGWQVAGDFLGTTTLEEGLWRTVAAIRQARGLPPLAAPAPQRLGRRTDD
ncbi:MAG: nucleoside-diphosphate sugar epimerase [Dehalococcoidia bacterium]|nr:MAG: nucleoside-diphosphate sugar epimerase [Dehalococcoidia bacterium]